MNYEQSEAYTKSIFASVKSFLHLCNSSILDVQTTETGLSVSGFSTLQTARLCTLYVNRLIHMFNYLIDNAEPPEEINFSCIELESLLENLCTHFQDTVFEHSSFSLQHRTSLKGSSGLLIDKTKFELLILNILHCSIKNFQSKDRCVPQLTIYITETKNSIVFHIRDNSKTLGGGFVQSASDIKQKSLSEFFTSVDVTLLNLAVAHKSAAEMGGLIKYTPLKSGNRFDIYLPKNTDKKLLRFNSPKPYSPDYELYLAHMADIILENDSSLKKEVIK